LGEILTGKNWIYVVCPLYPLGRPQKGANWDRGRGGSDFNS